MSSIKRRERYFFRILAVQRHSKIIRTRVVRMKFTSKQIVKELVKMDDIQGQPVGIKGTVIGVDDIGSIMVAWDNGSSLHIVYGEDMCKKI